MAVKREPLREVHGLESPEVAKVQDGVRDALRPLQRDGRPRRESWPLAADADPADATPETPIWRAEFDASLEGLSYLTASAIDADGTDFATFIFRVRDGSGGGTPAQVARTSTAETSVRAFQPLSLRLAGDRKLKRGSILTLEITKGGAGQTVGPGHVSIAYSEKAA